jgi:hypothetical protein
MFVNEFIYGILTGDEELCRCLGRIKNGDGDSTLVPSVHHGYSATWETYPSICFMQTDCSGEIYADDVCYAKKYTFEFDIFFETGGSHLFNHLNRVLTENGFTLVSSMDIAESIGKRINCTYNYLKEE